MNNSRSSSNSSIPTVNEFPGPLTMQTALNVLQSKYAQYTDRVCARAWPDPLTGVGSDTEY